MRSVLNVRLSSSMREVEGPRLQLAQCRHASLQCRARPVNARTVLHGRLHSLAEVGDPLPAALLQHLAFEPPLLVLDLGVDACAGLPGAGHVVGCGMACAGAEHQQLRKEFDPRRLAPLMLTQATSPAA